MMPNMDCTSTVLIFLLLFCHQTLASTWDDDNKNTCSTPTTTLDPATFNLHMVSGDHAYNAAWSKDPSNSLLFRQSIIQSIIHFRKALSIASPNTKHFEAAMWNLGVAIAYIECRLQVVDRWEFSVAQSWNDALLVPLRQAMQQRQQERLGKGLIIECGVGSGTTIRLIHNEMLRLGDATTVIHGFDSFWGLPEAWGGDGSAISQQYPVGSFNKEGNPPTNLPARVQLHVGMIDQTLPSFVDDILRNVDEKSFISFLHVDVDVYTSTFEVLASTVCLFVPGTVIEFDEALGYLNWQTSGEYRAWMEIVDLFDINCTPVTTYKMRMSVSIENENIRSFHPACRAYDVFPSISIVPKPSTFILGVQKCGTSTLAQMFRTSTEDLVFASPLEGEPEWFWKEVHFFSVVKRKQKGVQFYNDHFSKPLPHSYSRYIEATPNYFYIGATPMQRAYGNKAFANLKFILILKDPVARFSSWWNHFSVDQDFVALFMKRIFSKQLELSGGSQKMAQQVSMHTFLSETVGKGIVDPTVFSDGMYAIHLQKWLDVGAAPEQFEVVFLHELIRDSDATMARLFTFLEIPLPLTFPPLLHYNHYEKKEAMTDEEKNMLHDFYHPWNCKLAQLLDATGIRTWPSMKGASSGWVPSGMCIGEQQ